MENSEPLNPAERNYNTISPSAKSLLLLKALTNIPFARKAAGIVGTEGTQIFDFKKKKDFMFWARVVHFENRYWSIDQLLSGLNVKNILELSSGFSFRGLEMTEEKGIHYIDTDLPELIATKKELTAALQKEVQQQGTLEIEPLNALDKARFKELISHFPPGEIAIVNEGLLMYLGVQEKEQLCSIIREILKERGGYWITADIYIKRQIEKYNVTMDEKAKAFFEQHNIEGNKFDDYDVAEAFFKQQGLVIDAEAKMDHKKLSTLKQLMKSATLWQLFKMRKRPTIHKTWRLRVDPGSK